MKIKDLAIHLHTIRKVVEWKQALTSFHSLVATYGTAHLVMQDKKYEIPKALPNGQMLFVPSSVKN